MTELGNALEVVCAVVDEVGKVIAVPVVLKLVDPEVSPDDVELLVAVSELLGVEAVLTAEVTLLTVVDAIVVERRVDVVEMVEDSLVRLLDDEVELAEAKVLRILVLVTVLTEEVEVVEDEGLDVVSFADVD